MKAPWWKLPICWLGYCGHKAVCDDTGCWGECVTCGSRAGFVSRDILRTAADREYAARLRELARLSGRDHEERIADAGQANVLTP